MMRYQNRTTSFAIDIKLAIFRFVLFDPSRRLKDGRRRRPLEQRAISCARPCHAREAGIQQGLDEAIDSGLRGNDWLLAMAIPSAVRRRSQPAGLRGAGVANQATIQRPDA
jgi:hypothetical protein